MNKPVRSVVIEKRDIARSEERDGMRIDWDLPITMDDGLVLRADVFRPLVAGRYPVLLSYGPYGKGLAFQDGYPTCWEKMVTQHPDVTFGTTSKYQNWEVVDPEKWVPHGYAIVRIDSRGAGRSPGYLMPFCMRETQDIYHCIEWTATQGWSNSKIGMTGISYYAANQWLVAALDPPHLAAMCIWEGLTDSYRDANYHGGIMQTMPRNWWDMQIAHVQHGYGTLGFRSRVTGELVAGPETLSDEELAANRERYGTDLATHSFDDDFHRERSAQFHKIKIPLLSAGNWGGQGLHTRGNVEGFVRSASKQKWLEMHGLEHWTEFYTDYGVGLQRRFFDHFLKGEDNGWDNQPPVMLRVRHIDRFEDRSETEWPMARTQWTKFFLDPEGLRLTNTPPSANRSITYAPLRDGVTFLSDPLAAETEITGQSACKLFISSATKDADVFLVLRVFAPDMKEIVFAGALDPHTPVGQGWLRASHRELDPSLSKPYRPYHLHQRRLPLTPGEKVELDIEILPTSIVIPAGYRVGLSVRGRDYVYPGGSGGRLSNMKNEFTGCGPFLHNDGDDRPLHIFGGDVTIHTGANTPSHVLLPIVPLSNDARGQHRDV